MQKNKKVNIITTNMKIVAKKMKKSSFFGVFGQNAPDFILK